MTTYQAIPTTDASNTTLQKLTPFGWSGGLTAMLCTLVVSFFLFGFWYPYWRIADQDIFMVYSAFGVNDGLPRAFVDHPAYFTVLAIAEAFRVLHHFGAMASYSLSTLPPVSDVAAYNDAWTLAVRVGRVISLGVALLYVVTFAYLLRALVRNWRIALIGAFFLAFSGGLAMSLRSIKTELITCFFLTPAWLILLIAARSSRLAWRPLLVGLAALLATLATENKVQSIFIVMILPLLLLPFGEKSEPSGFWTGPRAYAALVGIGVLALASAIAAWPLVREGLPPTAGHLASKRSVFGAYGVFQALLAIWLALGMLAFARLWRVPVLETAATALSVIGGVAIGLLALYIAHDKAVVGAAINPLDQLLIFAGYVWRQLNSCHSIWCGPLFKVLAVDVPHMIEKHTFFLDTSPRPAIFLEWAVIAATVVAYRRGHVKVALQVAALLLAVWCIDILQATRGLKQEYFNFTDPFIIVAAVILVAKLDFIRQSRLTYPIGLGLFVLHVTFSQAEPVKHAFMRSGPETKCSILNLPNLSRFPFCRG